MVEKMVAKMGRLMADLTVDLKAVRMVDKKAE
jgi:hypothetical protein